MTLTGTESRRSRREWPQSRSGPRPLLWEREPGTARKITQEGRSAWLEVPRDKVRSVWPGPVGTEAAGLRDLGLSSLLLGDHRPLGGETQKVSVCWLRATVVILTGPEEAVSPESRSPWGL